MKNSSVFLPLLMFLLCHLTASAAIYRWVDKNGVVSFRDTPPPDNAAQVQIISHSVSPPVSSAVREPAPPVDVSSRPSAPPPATPPVAAAAPDYSGAQVELYVTSWCPYCKDAIAFLNAQGVRFAVYDIEKDSAAARRKEQLDGRKGVPFAVINGQGVHGYSEQGYLRALGAQR